MGGKEQNTAGEESLERALEELLLVEEARPESGVVQLGVLDRVVRVHVLVEDAEGEHRLRRVEQVVDGDEGRLLEEGLRREREGKKERACQTVSDWATESE